METKTHHSTYRGYAITKVTQESGRVTYDIFEPGGDLSELGIETLAVAKATINADQERLAGYPACR